MRIARTMYVCMAVVLIPFGLGTKSYHGPLQSWIHSYAGDVLVAIFLYLLLRGVLPRLSPAICGLTILCVSIVVECSQLFTSPFLEQLRQTFPGRVILGASFDWIDLLCYALGVGLAVSLDWGWLQGQGIKRRVKAKS